jgi:putative Holliday junction resolvase
VRVLALDWGEVRVGAAVSDESGKIAFALDKFLASKNAIAEIKKLIEELKIEKVLIGEPKSLDGSVSHSSEKVREFVEKLKKEITVETDMLDERFSSVAAGRMLSEQGLSEKKQRGMKDNIAAQLMLQQYLDSKNN